MSCNHLEIKIDNVARIGAKESQDKVVTPSKENQVVVADSGKVLGQVNVKPIPSEYVIPSGEITITEQGTFNVKEYDKAVVTAPFDSKFAQLINGTLTEVTEEDLQGVTKLRSSAFSGQSLMTKVKLPNTIQEIGNSAFAGCANLRELSLDDNIIKLGDTFIANCPNLNLTYIQPPTTQISSNTFGSANGVRILAIGGVLNKTFTGTGFIAGASGTKLVKLNEEVIQTGNFYNNTGVPTNCIYDFPTTMLNIGMIYSDPYNSAIKFTVIRAVNPPTLTANNNLGNTKPRFVPYESIDSYKSATNWSAKASYIYPFVYSLEDLSNIDTSKYTKALHLIENGTVSLDNYQVYNYTNGEWVKES